MKSIYKPTKNNENLVRRSKSVYVDGGGGKQLCGAGPQVRAQYAYMVNPALARLKFEVETEKFSTPGLGQSSQGTGKFFFLDLQFSEADVKRRKN